MGSNFITPTVSINILKKISLADSLKLPKVQTLNVNNNTNNETEFVTINPPENSNKTDFVQIRILSNELRDGMVKKLK